MSNPITIGIFCGLSLNILYCVVFGMESIPLFIKEICLMIKNSYPFTALFIIGYGISESNVSLYEVKNKRIITLLVIGKSLISPIVFYSMFEYLTTDQTVRNVASMACFYGLLPVSASPTVMSIQYKVYDDIMEIATIINLVVSMPMLIIYLYVVKSVS